MVLDHNSQVVLTVCALCHTVCCRDSAMVQLSVLLCLIPLTLENAMMQAHVTQVGRQGARHGCSRCRQQAGSGCRGHCPTAVCSRHPSQTPTGLVWATPVCQLPVPPYQRAA